MFIGPWDLAEDEGVVCGDALVIKSELFPFERLRLKTVEDWIAQLIEAIKIIPLNYQGESDFVICTLKTHQSINKTLEKVPSEIIQKQLLNTLKILPEYSLLERKGKEWKGREEAVFVFPKSFFQGFFERLGIM